MKQYINVHPDAVLNNGIITSDAVFSYNLISNSKYLSQATSFHKRYTNSHSRLESLKESLK